MTQDTFLLLVFAWLGLSVGSFLNVCIHRLPLGTSIVTPPSACPHCGYLLRWYDNIPVLSYAVLRGRCRGCRAPISIRYPVVEILTMALFVLHWYVFGWTALMGVRLAFACALLVLFAIDLEHQILPDKITLPGIVFGAVASVWLPPGIRDSLLGVLLGGGALWLVIWVYYLFTGQEGMGFGDVKMLAMIGAVLGWQQVLVTLVLGSVSGSIIGLIVIRFAGRDMKYALPFGTFLALGALAASLAGSEIVAWYLGFYPE
jgi:leader peptidase (prepilin peptidase) / N-methyltransferase